MTQQVINTGLAPNDGTGAPLRTAFTETNQNFDQVWAAGPVGSNVRIVDNRILTLNTNGNLTLAPNGTGRVVANVDVVPNLSNIRNLGSAAQRWDTVYTRYLDITGDLVLSDVEVDDLTVRGNLTVNGTTTTINTANLDVVDKLITVAYGSPNAAVANGAGIRVDGADAAITYSADTDSWVVNLPLSVTGNIQAGNIVADTFVGNLSGTADRAAVADSVAAANVSGLAEVATSGSYADLSDVPTQVSAFENDSGYITSAVANVISVNGATGAVTLTIPTTTSNLTNDSGFITSAAIPTQVSAFENDANYITESAIPTQISAFSNDANYITSAVANVSSVNGATGVVSLEIPTATSDLSNDSGFITANVVGNLSATGNITGVYIKGNGSELTNLPAPAVAQDITSIGDMSIMAYDGNLKYVNNATVEPSTGNIKTAGNISATGNIAGNYILGNGSRLTGLPATYGNANVATFLSAFGSNTISTTGNITASNFVGNISITGNVQGTSANVTLVAGSYSWTFDNTGNVTLPTSGDVIMPGINSILSVSGTTLLGGYSQVAGYYSTLGVKYPGAGTQHGMTLQPTNDNTTAINFLNAAGNNIGAITQTSSTVKFVGDGSSLTNVATKSSGSWTVPVGNSTQSFTVTPNETYYMWVDCNIPNGILVWNATVTVTNTNVPVVGAQYSWVYNGGGTPIDFTSIPNQFVGTANTIVRSNVAPGATTNRFDFGINNTSGGNVTVRYGWIQIS